MLHGCSRQDLLNIGHRLAAAWELTKNLCPKWDKDVAEYHFLYYNTCLNKN